MAYLDLRIFLTFHTYSLTPLELNLTVVTWRAKKNVGAVALKSAELFQWLTESCDLFYWHKEFPQNIPF